MAQGSPPRLPPNKLPGLEVLRFIAAVAVLLWHYQHFAFVADTPVGLTKPLLPFYGALQPFYEAGLFGVWIFWCISGFIFFWKYLTPIADGAVSGWQFFVFRLSRLYPLHLVMLLAVALLQFVYIRLTGYFFVYQDNDLRHFLLQLMMASNWGLQNNNSFDGPIWSVSVEVLVYVVFFVLLRFVSASALVSVAMVAACAIAHQLGVQNHIVDCLAFFYLGGLAAILKRRIVGPKVAGVATGAAAVLAAVIVTAGLAPSVNVSAFAFLLTVTPVVIFSVSGPMPMPASAQRLVEDAGNMTYAIYLLHFPIQLVIALGYAALRLPIPYYQAWFFAAFVITTLAASYATYRWFEAPSQAMMRASLLRRRTAPVLRGAE